jgi:hypothetical protein
MQQVAEKASNLKSEVKSQKSAQLNWAQIFKLRTLDFRLSTAGWVFQ